VEDFLVSTINSFSKIREDREGAIAASKGETQEEEESINCFQSTKKRDNVYRAKNCSERIPIFHSQNNVRREKYIVSLCLDLLLYARPKATRRSALCFHLFQSSLCFRLRVFIQNVSALRTDAANDEASTCFQTMNARIFRLALRYLKRLSAFFAAVRADLAVFFQEW
jgi:hypothetical protein